MLPAQATIYAALLSNEPFFDDRTFFWQSTRDTYGIDLAVFGWVPPLGLAMASARRRPLMHVVSWAMVSCSAALLKQPPKEAMIDFVGPENVISRPAAIAVLDLATVTIADVQVPPYPFPARHSPRAVADGVAPSVFSTLRSASKAPLTSRRWFPVGAPDPRVIAGRGATRDADAPSHSRPAGPLHGVVTWFDVTFPAPPDEDPSILSTSPYQTYAGPSCTPRTVDPPALTHPHSRFVLLP